MTIPIFGGKREEREIYLMKKVQSVVNKILRTKKSHEQINVYIGERESTSPRYKTIGIPLEKYENLGNEELEKKLRPKIEKLLEKAKEIEIKDKWRGRKKIPKKFWLPGWEKEWEKEKRIVLRR